jgi:hypothetical protein
MDWQPWVTLAHILGAFAFAAAHGTSMLMAFKLRTERDPGKLAGMLDLSMAGINWLTWAFLLLLASGIASGFLGDYWGKGWIWVSIGVLVVVTGLMTPFGAIHYSKVRAAIGMPNPRKKDEPAPTPVPAAELDALLTSARPWILLGIGGVGFAAIIFLMRFKPF